MPSSTCRSASGHSTQEDPIGLAGGLNLYNYGGSDPINNSDPFGLTPWLIRGPHPTIGYEPEVVELGFPDWGPGGRGMIKAVRGMVTAARSGTNLVRHAANLRGYLMHLTPRDLAGAARELRGLSSGAEHLQEVREAAGGLRSLTKTLKNALANSELSQIERRLYERMLGTASRALDEAETVLRSGQTP